MEKILQLGNDYILEYRYMTDTNVGGNGMPLWKEAGTLINAKDILLPGTEVCVNAIGKGNYSGTVATTITVVEGYDFDKESKL